MDFTGNDTSYCKTNLELEAEYLSRYIFVSDIVKNKKVLDIACGTGNGTKMLAQNASEVFGIDVSENTILCAKNNYIAQNIKFCVADVENLPFEPDFFDIIVSFGTIGAIDDEQKQKKFLSEIKRTLKKDGILIISMPNNIEIYEKKEKSNLHITELSFLDFKTILENNFKNIQIFNQKFEMCNVISSDKNKNVYKIGSLNPKNSDYIIAVCSNESLPTPLNNIVNFYNENKSAQMINSAITIHKLTENNNDIKKIFDKNKELEKEIADLDKQNEKLEQQLFLECVKSKEIKTELEQVYNSRGHKMLKKLYVLESIIIPHGSRRRFILKLILKIIRHPVVFLKKINITNLKNVILSLIQGNIYSLSEKISISNEDKGTFVFEPIDLNQTEFETIKLPSCDEPLVSIIIPVYNQFHYTYNCIKSIINHTRGINYEVIVADDVSTDKTKEIENIIKNLKVIHNEKNLGFLLNCNNAAKYAKGKYIHFLNNDTSVQRAWLSSLLNLIETDDKIGMVGSKLVYPKGILQEAGGIFWNDATAWNYGRNKGPMAPEYNYVKEVDYISGASILIRKSLWDKIGGFDERFIPAYYEDSDLAFEVRKHGYKVVYQPESVVVHFEGISNGTDTSFGIKSYQIENKDKFFEKWKNVLTEEHFENGKNVFLARDRSKNKKCILFVDHYVPTFDKDAGSRATYQHLKLLAELGFNIKFIGDNFLKYEKYTKALENLGIEVLYGSKYTFGWKAWIKENSAYIDTVVLSRPHIAQKYIKFIKKYTNAKIIYYVHDLHFLREYREFELTKNLKLKSSSEYWKKIELNLIEKSDIVVTFSSDEKKIIDSHFFKEKAVVVPIFIYDKLNNDYVDLTNRKNLLFVGGFNHKPNEDGVIWFVNKIWPTILKEIPDCKFIVAGSNPTEKIRSLANENILVTGFVPDDELQNYYNQCKVCVIPLRFGAGVKGKTIEAIYHKIPIVSTPIGIEGLCNIEDYIFSTDSPDKFAQKVIEYYKNNELANQNISKYHEYLNNYFSTDYATKIFKNIF